LAKIHKYTNGTQTTCEELDGVPVLFSIKTHLLKNRKTVFDIENGQYAPSSYMVGELIARASINNKEIKQCQYFEIATTKPYLQQVAPLWNSPTTGEFEIELGLGKIGSFGPSPLHDAVCLALARMAEWQESHEEYHKVLFVLSDGWENLSERTIVNAIGAVSRNSNSNGNVVSIGLGQPNGVGEVILQKYADEGRLTPLLPPLPILSPLGESTSSNGEEWLESLSADLISKYPNKGSVVYDFVLGRTELITAALAEFEILGGTGVVFVRIKHNSSWGQWFSKKITSGSLSVDFSPSYGELVQFRILLSGSSDFASHRLLGLGIEFTRPRESTIVFAPINIDAGANESISELVVSDHIVSGGKSTVSYAVCVGDALSEVDIFKTDQLPFKRGRRQVVLSRSNEPLIRIDQHRYRFANGPWSSGLSVEVRSLLTNLPFGRVVPVQDFTAMPESGEIVFVSPRAPSVVLVASLGLPHKFRLFCRVVNYSTSAEDAVVINHFGVLWNVTKATREIGGTPVRQPMSVILTPV
jgi:hypothetical protein